MDKFDWEEHTEPAPILRLIFVSQQAKEYFLERFADNKHVNVMIGASEEKALIDVEDISVMVYDDNKDLVM